MKLTRLVESFLDHLTPDRVDVLGKSLTPEELFALAIILGYKPAGREREAEDWGFDYKAYISSLSKKGALTNSGKIHKKSYDIFHVQLPKQSASQLHAVHEKLKDMGLKVGKVGWGG